MENAADEIDENILTVEDIKKIKVIELKTALKDRNLSCCGKKAELLDRLIEAIESGAPLLKNMSDQKRGNMAGEGFSFSARWVLKEPNVAAIEDEDRTARARTVSEGESTCVKKYNYSDTYDRPLFIQQVII